ncbi:hypothetical protein [Terriglobus sp.]|uniref:hypothetical protein n=1 Tax=Terriglobus sp. TaxID=1889013 RepID=UPI003B00E22A
MDRILQSCVVVAAVLTALCSLYFASYLIRIYLSLGQPLIAALALAKGSLLYFVAYVAGALAYWFFPRLRPLLTGVAVIAATFAIMQASTYWSLVQERNLFRNMLAEPMWEMFGRCAIALFALAHLAVEKRGAIRR